MVSKNLLPYQLKISRTQNGVTGLAGLPLYLDLAHVLGLCTSIDRHVKARIGGQGWSDRQMILSLVLLNLAGGDCVDDVSKLEQDSGLSALMRRVETAGMKRCERRKLEHRWRKERHRSAPSASSVRRYLNAFCTADTECIQPHHKAFIGKSSDALLGLHRVNRDLVGALGQHLPCATATLDIDATLIETTKAEALFCYKKHRAYQPLNVWWAEQSVVIHSEFRDGNVPAGFEQTRVFREALSALPTSVKKVSTRSDTAGYQWEFLRYCAEGKCPRFGVIDFGVGVSVTSAFKDAVLQVREEDWHPLTRRNSQGGLEESAQEWAEVCFVPNQSAIKKDGPMYRFLAIREPVRQPWLPGLETQAELPFPTISYGEDSTTLYKLRGIVTNRDIPGDELIWWVRQRCGKSEEVHSVMKHDFAGGVLPSKHFGANAAWWAIMILALNLNTMMKRLVLGKPWVNKRLKAIRYWIINVPGRLIHHSRQMVLTLSANQHCAQLLLDARSTIEELAHSPPT